MCWQSLHLFGELIVHLCICNKLNNSLVHIVKQCHLDSGVFLIVQLVLLGLLHGSTSL